MKNIIFKVLPLLVGISSLQATAQQFLFAESVRLEFEESVDYQWAVPPGADSAVYLIFDARIDAGDFTSGGAPALQILVNRVPVTVDRLENKQTQWIHGTRRYVSWGTEKLIMVLYHEWDEEGLQFGRLHRYAFDISSLLKKEGENVIQFKSVFEGIPNSIVDIRNIHIQTGGEIARHPLPVVEEPLYISHPLTSFRERAIALHRGTQLELDTTPDFKDGEIAVHADSPLIAEPLEAVFSATDGLRLDLNGFKVLADLSVGLPGTNWTKLDEKGWKVLQSDGKSIVYTNEKIRIEREIVSFEHGVSIRDTVTNLTSGELPLGMLYELDLGEKHELEEFRLFGSKQGSLYSNSLPSRMSAATPSLFFRNGKGSFGCLIEDDILRNQASYLAWDDTVAFGTDMFYLKAGASHEFLWSLIPTGQDGYYDFLNKVRVKWDTYQEIPGLFGFVYPEGKDRSLTTPEAIKRFLENTGITNPCIPPSTDHTPTQQGGVRMIYGNEPESVVKPVLDKVEAFIGMARDGGVEDPFLLYTDVHIVRTDGDQGVLEELDDSLILDYRGNPVEYRHGWLYNLLANEDTSAGERFLNNLKMYMDTPGVKGIFLDEWDHSRARISFNHPDGRTALLDENFQIIRKVGIVPLLFKSYQTFLFGWLAEKNAVIYANQFDSTRSSTMLPIVHFAEPTQYDSYLLRAAQLSRTPLSLTVKRSSDPWLDTHEFLKQGILTCFYAQRLTGDHMLKHIYPITARRTGPGYVIGDDRIVTLAPGKYSFGDERPIRAKIFGGKGGVYLRTEEIAGVENEVTVFDLQLDTANREAAVIEPVSGTSG